MEQGSLRCDVNTSLNLPGAEWGTRTETKNVNSLRSVERAVRSEMIRQAGVLDAGGRIIQETRHFHEDPGETSSGRCKEEATDYRYFPEPDLVPIAPDAAWVAELKAALPELPSDKRARLREEWGISEFEMQSVANAGAVDLIEETIAAGASPAGARKWWMGELARRANERRRAVRGRRHTGAGGRAAAAGRRRQAERQAGPRGARGRRRRRGDPAAVMAARGIGVVSDTGALTAAVDEAIAANPDIAAKVRDGKLAAAGVLVGAVMKTTRGQADAKTVRELIISRLSS